ncbi:MAG TPA: hypothetical protein PKL83_05725 [bacterium]|nr:hypothetical protein [bacterium]
MLDGSYHADERIPSCAIGSLIHEIEHVMHLALSWPPGLNTDDRNGIQEMLAFLRTLSYHADLAVVKQHFGRRGQLSFQFGAQLSHGRNSGGGMTEHLSDIDEHFSGAWLMHTYVLAYLDLQKGFFPVSQPNLKQLERAREKYRCMIQRGDVAEVERLTKARIIDFIEQGARTGHRTEHEQVIMTAASAILRAAYAAYQLGVADFDPQLHQRIIDLKAKLSLMVA